MAGEAVSQGDPKRAEPFNQLDFGLSLKYARVELWTDGSGTRAGEPGGWAYVAHALSRDGALLREIEGSGGSQDTTNNRMELTAVLKGLEVIRKPAIIRVHSDSEYIVNAFRKGWLHSWNLRGWRKVKNDDLWKTILRLTVPHRVEFVWVKGHSGIELNERCDKMAGARRKEMLELREKALAEAF